jgi:hypothetical protein
VGEALKRLLQTVRLERDAFVWMDFNDRATADGLIFVVATRFLILLGEGWTIRGLSTTLSGIEVLIFAMLNALIFWLVYSGIVFAVTKFLLDGSGAYATYLRVTGFAYPTLLLFVFTVRLGITRTAAFVLASAWLLVIVTRGVIYEGDVPIEKAAFAAGAGLAGWIILSAILKRGMI